jgi:tetratricopeptide (TPR) repeat protein
VAASLILLLGITGIISRQSGDIYQKFYTRYEATGIVRSANTSANQTLTQALQKFENQDYKAALDLFSEIIAKDQNNMVGHFYAGVSLQETGKYQNAIEEYQTVIIDKDNLFTEQAEWYIGLCYLQTNEDKKAYKQFKKIAKNEGFYQHKAQAILNKIKVSE